MFDTVRLVLLCALFTAIKSDEPDCGIRNQFRGYCFSFEYCTVHGCGSLKCGHFPRYSTILKIKQTKIIPKCAITNSTILKHIMGINTNIHVLASGAFVNLSNLESIRLPFNEIRELHPGVFFNVEVSLLDLSWNKIIYISEGAFNGITGLKYLNLSKNELSTIPVENLPKSLVQINLSRNFLERIALNGAKRPDLTSVDLSYNNLKNVALSFDNPLEKMDLTRNQLQNIDFYDINDCDNLRIPLNLFTDFPQFLEYSRIRRVALHPNPWKCDELRRLWMHLQNNNIEEEKSIDGDTQPVCSINTEGVLARITGNSFDLDCDNDNHCADNMLCRAHKCWDPCDTACHTTNKCMVSNHEIECLCLETQKMNPYEINSPCYDVECFINADCPYGSTCMQSNYSCVVTIVPPLVPTAGGAAYSSSSSSFFASSYGNGSIIYGHVKPWWFEEIPKLYPSSARIEK